MDSICIILNENNTLDNFISGNNWKESKKVLCVNNPVNKNVIEKYYLDDEEIDTIKEAMSEKPEIIEFDNVFKSSNLHHFFNCYLVSKFTNINFNQFFVIYSNKFKNLFWNSQSPTDNFLLNYIIENLLKNGEKKINFRGNLLVGDYITEIYDTSKQKTAISTKTDFENCMSVFDKKICDFLNQLEIDNDVDLNLMLFLSLQLESGVDIFFLILPELENHIDYKKSFLNSILNLILKRLESNLESDIKKEYSFSKSKIEQDKKDSDYFSHFLKENLPENFEMSFLVYLMGNEENYKGHLNLIKHIEYGRKHSEMLLEKNSILDQKEKAEKIQKPIYVDRIDQNIEKMAKRQSLINSSLQNTSQKKLGKISPGRIFDSFVKENNFVENLNLSLKNSNFNPLKNELKKTPQIYPKNLIEENMKGSKTKGDLTDTIGRNLFKLMKEKVGRNEDLFEFRYKEVERENMFLKNSCKQQNKNFMKLKKTLDEKNAVIEELKEKFENEEKKNCAFEIKYKEMKNNNKFLKNLNEEIKLKNAKLEEVSKQKENENFKLIKEKDKILVNHKLEREELKRQIKSLEEMKFKLEGDIKDYKNEILGFRKGFDNHQEIVSKNSAHEFINDIQKENTEKILNLKNKEIENFKKDIEKLKDEIKIVNQEVEEGNKKLKKKKKIYKGLLFEKENEKIKQKDDFLKEIEKINQQLQLQKEALLKNEFKIMEVNKENTKLKKKSDKYKKLRKEKNELEKNHIESKTVLENLTKVHSSKKTKLETLELELTTLRNDLQQSEQKNVILSSSLEKIQQELKNISGEKNNLFDQVQNNQLLLNDLKNELQQKESFIIDLNRNFELKLEKIVEEVEILQKDNTILNENKNNILKENQILKEKLKNNKFKIEEWKNKNDMNIKKMDKYKEELRDKIGIIQRFHLDKEKEFVENKDKLSMIKGIKNIITCYKNLNN